MDRQPRRIFEDSRPSQSNTGGVNDSAIDLNESSTGAESSRKLNRSISPIGQHDQSFDSSSEFIKPMLLVDIDNKGMMKINRKAIEYLQTIKKNVNCLNDFQNFKLLLSWRS